MAPKPAPPSILDPSNPSSSPQYHNIGPNLSNESQSSWADPMYVSIGKDGWPYSILEDTSHLSTPGRSETVPPVTIIREDLLQNCLYGQPGYAEGISEAVKEVVLSLKSLGRTHDAKGMEALLVQSFKDAGTASLLDAVLRRRPTHLQVADFKRYIKEVNFELPPLESEAKPIPTNSETKRNAAPRRRSGLADLTSSRQPNFPLAFELAAKARELQGSDDEGSTCSVISFDADTIREGIFGYARNHFATNRTGQQEDPGVMTPVPGSKRKRTRRRHRRRSANDAATAAEAPEAAEAAEAGKPDEAEAAEVSLNLDENSHEVATATATDVPNPAVGSPGSSSEQPLPGLRVRDDLPATSARSRRKRNRNRTSSATIGPVPTHNFVQYPLPPRAANGRARRLAPTTHFYY